MPIIELLPKKKRSPRERGYRLPERGAQASELYNTDLWHRTRRSYLMSNPECEVCAELGRITLATDVHHIDHLSDAENKLDMMDRAFDSNNLMALCHKCHMKYHGLTSVKRPVSEEERIFLEAYNKVLKKHDRKC